MANPPYMGAKNMNAWLSGWVKKNYPDVKGDLFSCFMVRNTRMGSEHAQLGFMTPCVWMFIGTYEKLREFVVKKNTITSLTQLEYSGFSGATVPICTFTLQKGLCPGYKGGYIRLSDFVGADQQGPRALQALADPDCGWFYRADAKSFEIIPGSPIAYWASSSMIDAFRKSRFLGETGRTSKGLITGDNNRFLRLWWECGSDNALFYSKSFEDILDGRNRWFACTKGGPFRKWAGNTDWVVDWRHNGEFVKSAADETGHHCQDYNDKLKFKKSITWSAISSDAASFRYAEGTLSEHAGMCCFLPERIVLYALALLNSSVVGNMMSLIAPTLNFNAGDVDSIPLIANEGRVSRVNEIAGCNISFSQCDWDSRETSWNFERHRLV